MEGVTTGFELWGRTEGSPRPAACATDPPRGGLKDSDRGAARRARNRSVLCSQPSHKIRARLRCMHHCVARPSEGCWCTASGSQRTGIEGSMLADSPTLCDAASSMLSTTGDSTCSPSILELEQVPQLPRLSPATPYCAPPVTPCRLLLCTSWVCSPR